MPQRASVAPPRPPIRSIAHIARKSAKTKASGRARVTSGLARLLQVLLNQTDGVATLRTCGNPERDVPIALELKSNSVLRVTRRRPCRTLAALDLSPTHRFQHKSSPAR